MRLGCCFVRLPLSSDGGNSPDGEQGEEVFPWTGGREIDNEKKKTIPSCRIKTSSEMPPCDTPIGVLS